MAPACRSREGRRSPTDLNPKTGPAAPNSPKTHKAGAANQQRTSDPGHPPPELQQRPTPLAGIIHPDPRDNRTLSSPPAATPPSGRRWSWVNLFPSPSTTPLGRRRRTPHLSTRQANPGAPPRLPRPKRPSEAQVSGEAAGGRRAPGTLFWISFFAPLACSNARLRESPHLCFLPWRYLWIELRLRGGYLHDTADDPCAPIICETEKWITTVSLSTAPATVAERAA